MKLYLHLSAYVSSVRAAQAELTQNLLSKLEDTEGALLSKSSGALEIILDSLKDAVISPHVTTKNLESLLSEKLSKSVVLATKSSINS